jgi:hypothetical protein
MSNLLRFWPGHVVSHRFHWLGLYARCLILGKAFYAFGNVVPTLPGSVPLS